MTSVRLFVYVFIALMICYSSGLSLRYFLFGGLGLAVMSPVIWHFLSDYQKARITVGINPESDPLGYGYQVILSRSAVIAGYPLGSRFLELEYFSDSARESYRYGVCGALRSRSVQ